MYSWKKINALKSLSNQSRAQLLVGFSHLVCWPHCLCLFESVFSSNNFFPYLVTDLSYIVRYIDFTNIPSTPNMQHWNYVIWFSSYWHCEMCNNACMQTLTASNNVTLELVRHSPWPPDRPLRTWKMMKNHRRQWCFWHVPLRVNTWMYAIHILHSDNLTYSSSAVLLGHPNPLLGHPNPLLDPRSFIKLLAEPIYNAYCMQIGVQYVAHRGVGRTTVQSVAGWCCFIAVWAERGSVHSGRQLGSCSNMA